MSETPSAVHGDVAVILIDNPPVNGLGHAQRERMAAELDRAWADPAVRAIVVAGAGKLFCGGADIKAFNTPASRAEPSSRTLVKRIEQTRCICRQHLRGVRTRRLVTLTYATIIKCDHLKMLRQKRNHLVPLPTRIPKTRNQHERLSRAAADFVVEFDSV